MMIDDVQRKLKGLCQQIHNSLRKQKTVTIFWLELSSKMNHLSSEPSNVPQFFWNHCNHFEEFITPKENMSLSLKDNCFDGDTVTLQKLNKVTQVHNLLED